MRVKLIALLAKLLRIQFKINGLPYGATMNERHLSATPRMDSSG